MMLIVIALASLTATLSISYHLYNKPRCTQWVEIDVGDRVYRERLCSTGRLPTRLEPPQK